MEMSGRVFLVNHVQVDPQTRAHTTPWHRDYSNFPNDQNQKIPLYNGGHTVEVAFKKLIIILLKKESIIINTLD